MKNIITWNEENPHIIEKGRDISIWHFLESLFTSVWEISWVRLKNKHALFQSLLSMKNDSEDLKLFLERRWYRFISEFNTLESFHEYITWNSEIYKKIKSWMFNVWLVFTWFTPSSIVITNQVESDKRIHEHITRLGQEISESISDIIL